MTNNKKLSKDKKKIKVFCLRGNPVEITKNYANGIKKQIVKNIKAKRLENRDTAQYYFYGIADYILVKDNDMPVLRIEYGDALSALDVVKKNKIYVEVPFRMRITKKSPPIIL